MGKAGVKNDTVSKCAEVEVDAHKAVDDRECAGVNTDANEKLVGESGKKLITNGSEVTPKYSTLEQRYSIVPPKTSDVGEWTGEPGESMFISSDPRVKDILEENGQKGVNYRNGMPDFSPFVKEEFTIKMTNNRQKNFAQANKQLAEKLTKETGEKWTQTKVSQWISDNNYTWHELNDCETIQLVPSAINHPIFKHMGGVGEINIALGKGVSTI